MPAATLVVTTKNRRDELARLLESAVGQTADLEILVIDDGSVDGSAEMVVDRFPQVRLERDALSRGYIVQRNRGARLARGPIVVSVDDDAELASPTTVERTLPLFDDERVGAVAIPFVDVEAGDRVWQRAPGPGRWATATFRGTAYAVRRDLFLALDGFREVLVHQAEEHDFCLRMLACGRFTTLGDAEPILHFESPRRDRRRQFRLWARNDMLYGWHNVPMPYLLGRWMKVVAFWTLHGLRTRHLKPVLQGLVAGAAYPLRAPRARRPVPRAAYALDRDLRRRGAIPIDEAAKRLQV